MGENGSQTQVSDHQQNIELMRAMGARSYDPIPPDQYLYHLDDDSRLHRLLAWMLSKTIRKGHRRHYAVDQNHRALTLSDLAADCFYGNLGNTSACWSSAEDQKLVYRDEEGRLCLSGKVPPRVSLKKQQDGSESRFCTENLLLRTENLKERFNSLPVEDQQRFRKCADQFTKWADNVRADAMVAARALIEEQEKRLLAAYGMERRENGRNRRNLDENPLCLQLQLFSVPEFSGSKNGHSVQTTETIVYEPENGSVRNPFNKEAEYRENLIQSDSSSSSSAEVEEPTTTTTPPTQEQTEQIAFFADLAVIFAPTGTAPTPTQAEETRKVVHPHDREFLEWLSGKMAKIDGVGALKRLREEFLTVRAARSVQKPQLSRPRPQPIQISNDQRIQDLKAQIQACEAIVQNKGKYSPEERKQQAERAATAKAELQELTGGTNG